MNAVIPARGKGREILDSVFLYRYARRNEGRASWLVPAYALWGALVGYGLALAIIALMGMLASAVTLVPTMFVSQPLVVPTLPYLRYIDIILPCVFGVIWGMRGIGKADEIRFKAQMALHVLRLQEMITQETTNG